MRSIPVLCSVDEKRDGRRSLRIFLLILAVAVPPAVVVANERTCRGELAGASIDSLRVPDGATCTLRRTHVKGTIKVGAGATLFASTVRVLGNIQAENARRLSVTHGSRIGGSVQIKQGGSVTVEDSTVQGDIQYEANDGPLRANDNNVGGNVQVIGNRGRAEIYSNVIDGNLQCKENRPRPTGGRNKVRGNREDQCATF
jgi:hypothetical protein